MFGGCELARSREKRDERTTMILVLIAVFCPVKLIRGEQFMALAGKWKISHLGYFAWGVFATELLNLILLID